MPIGIFGKIAQILGKATKKALPIGLRECHVKHLFINSAQSHAICGGDMGDLLCGQVQSV